MTRVDAIYQDGVFRPLTPIHLEENQRVALCVEPLRREDALAWIERVGKSRREFAAEHGVLPDSTIDIAADRMR